MARTKGYTVHIYKPNGERLGIYDFPSLNAQIAIAKAKRFVYRMGRLAHFYSYVPVLKEA